MCTGVQKVPSNNGFRMANCFCCLSQMVYLAHCRQELQQVLKTARLFLQDRDQDQMFKTKTKTSWSKTKTYTFIFDLEAPRDQDTGSRGLHHCSRPNCYNCRWHDISYSFLRRKKIIYAFLHPISRFQLSAIHKSRTHVSHGKPELTTDLCQRSLNCLIYNRKVYSIILRIRLAVSKIRSNFAVNVANERAVISCTEHELLKWRRLAGVFWSKSYSTSTSSVGLVTWAKVRSPRIWRRWVPRLLGWWHGWPPKNALACVITLYWVLLRPRSRLLSFIAYSAGALLHPQCTASRHE